mmetsp:Transcript_7381/g.24494  ORF Transcript_7381/g.24494 Transcript_7381/m.24494 type:complete len:257 (+) Transcript_7381:691-1461(+)
MGSPFALTLKTATPPLWRSIERKAAGPRFRDTHTIALRRLLCVTTRWRSPSARIISPHTACARAHSSTTGYRSCIWNATGLFLQVSNASRCSPATASSLVSPSSRYRCISLSSSMNRTSPSRPSQIICVVCRARMSGDAKQLSNGMRERASRHRSACFNPSSVSSDSLVLPWMRPSSFHVDTPCRTRTIFFSRPHPKSGPALPPAGLPCSCPPGCHGLAKPGGGEASTVAEEEEEEDGNSSSALPSVPSSCSVSSM